MDERRAIERERKPEAPAPPPKPEAAPEKPVTPASQHERIGRESGDPSWED